MAMNLNKPENEPEEKDINEVFTDILLNDENVIKDSYNEGYTIGASEFNVEAFHLGYHRGAELGAEIGYYSAIIRNYQKQFNENKIKNERALKTLDILTRLIASFPRHNDPNVDLIKLLDDIRAKFKKFCALLKIDALFPEIDNLSF